MTSSLLSDAQVQSFDRDATMTSSSLLSDAQVQSFIRDGFIVLNSDLSPSANERIADASKAIFKGGNKHNNPLDDVDKAIPEVLDVWSSPNVNGALRSLLGDDYVMHSHRHLHERLPGQDPTDQPFHVDDTIGVSLGERDQLEPWFLIGFYYPEKTTVDMGPTAVVGGTHLLETPAVPGVAQAVWSEDGSNVRKLDCEAGTVVLCDFRLVHKGCGNVSNKPRFMFKYNFLRTTVGEQPAWRHTSAAWQLPPHPMLPKLQPVCEDIWRGFMLGTPRHGGEEAGEAAANDSAVPSLSASSALHLLMPTEAAERVVKAGEEETSSVNSKYLSAAAAGEAAAAAAPPDILAELHRLIELDSSMSVQARTQALAAAKGDARAAERLIARLGRTAANLKGSDNKDEKMKILTTNAIATAIGRLAELAPSAATDAYGQMLLQPPSVAHHAASGLAAASIRLQRSAHASGAGAGGDAARATADSFVRSAVLLLTAALSRSMLVAALDQDATQPDATSSGYPQTPLASSLVSALGKALSCVQAADEAARRAHLYEAAVSAVSSALFSGAATSSDAVLALGRLGSAALASAEALTQQGRGEAAKAAASSYARAVRESVRVLRAAHEKQSFQGGAVLDYHSTRLATSFLERWAGRLQGLHQGLQSEPGKLAPQARKAVELVNMARGGHLALRAVGDGGKARHCLALPCLDDGRGVATLRDAAHEAPAPHDSTRFDLEPTKDADGSFFVVHSASGKALHLDGAGDQLASTRYGDVRDDFSKWLLVDAVSGDPAVLGSDAGVFYLVNKATRMPLHADGLGDGLVTTRFGDQRDAWAQWKVHTAREVVAGAA